MSPSAFRRPLLGLSGRLLPRIGLAPSAAPPLRAAPAAGPRPRFASTVFNVPARAGESEGEQTLFVVGLNEGKFFGQDSAEEALKLLERIQEHQTGGYSLLFGLTEKALAEIEEDHKVKNGRLSPSREVEGRRNCEVIPVVQAGMVDKAPRKAIGRVLRITQGHVAWQMWKHPRETIKGYWLYFQKNQHRNAECRHFWMKHVPTCAFFYFDECSELIAIRATESLVARQSQGKTGTFVLLVGNDLYEPVTEKLRNLLDGAPAKFASADFGQHMRERATELNAEVPDLTPILMLVYLGVPILMLQSLFLLTDRIFARSGLIDAIFEPEIRRD